MRAALLVSILFLGVLAPEALAAAATRAEEAVRITLSRAKQAERLDGTRAERLAAVRAAARELVDTRTMGRNAIGPVLEEQTEPDREEFLAHFDVLVVRSWMQKLLFFRDPQFAFAPSERHPDYILVRTKILTENDDYYVDYRMQDRNGRWWATDIVIEGMSLEESYQKQLASLLERRSFAELLDLMRRKTRLLRTRDDA